MDERNHKIPARRRTWRKLARQNNPNIYFLIEISSFVDDRSIRTSIIPFFFLLVASIISIIFFCSCCFFDYFFFSRVLKPRSEDVLCVDTHDVFFLSFLSFSRLKSIFRWHVGGIKQEWLIGGGRFYVCMYQRIRTYICRIKGSEMKIYKQIVRMLRV